MTPFSLRTISLVKIFYPHVLILFFHVLGTITDNGITPYLNLNQPKQESICPITSTEIIRLS